MTTDRRHSMSPGYHSTGPHREEGYKARGGDDRGIRARLARGVDSLTEIPSEYWKARRDKYFGIACSLTSVGAINLAVNLGDSEKDIIDKWGSLALTYGMIGFVATSMFHVFRSIKASEETKQEK